MAKSQKSRNDAAVQGTNDSSIVSKSSMCRRGYFKDDFVHFFISKPSRRASIINRGYYIRAKAVDFCIRHFLHLVEGKESQIISFGAGFDSTYFKLKSEGCLSTITYFEIDFPSVVSRKKSCILQNEALLNLIDLPVNLHEGSDSPLIISSHGYKLLGADLRYLNNLSKILFQCGAVYDKPTLFLAEVVLPYTDISSSSSLIKWSCQTFSNSVFVSYEQICPDDAFGLFMQQHFRKLGTPLKSLSTYPDIYSQEKRFLDLGWKNCHSLDMNSFFQKFVIAEEHQWIEEIEVFDEYEEWIEKCNHYAIIVAWNQIFGESIFLQNGNRPQKIDFLLEPRLSWELSNINPSLQRHSHCSEWLDSSHILTIGGFGKVNGHHTRGTGFTLFNLGSNLVFDLNVDDPDKCGNRIRHSLTRLHDGRILIFGGRFSPLKSFSDIICLNSDNSCSFHENSVLSVQKIPTRGIVPCSRWRHSANVIKIQDREKLIIYGGKTDCFTVLGDCFLIDTDDFEWIKIDLQGAHPGIRCSHSASVWNDYLIIACGLDNFFQPIHSIHALNLKNWIWENWSISELLPRFSHTAHVYKDHLILIGGVSNEPNLKPGVSVISLITRIVKNYYLPVQYPEKLIMLYNHSSVLTDDGYVIILGGGGNCFSFGTHLNSQVIRFDLNQLIS